MILARSGGTEVTDILLTGENIDPDIQENVSETPDYITHYWVTQYSYPFPTEHRMVSSLFLC